MHSIFNFTHVYEAYDFMQGEEFKWVDCIGIEGTDCYCDTEAERQLKEKMADLPLNAVHWIDSGDYHYLSKLWTDMIEEPFTLVVFDHHPDMQQPMFGSLLSCGSWVRVALERNPYIKKVVLIGVDDKLRCEAEGFPDKVVFFMTKYIFVTGGVVSGLGKGITAASLQGCDVGERMYHQLGSREHEMDTINLFVGRNIEAQGTGY